MSRVSMAKSGRTSKLAGYNHLREGIVEVLEMARRAAVRTLNAIMTAAYWETGRRIVEYEQGGAKRARYGKEILRQLASDLTDRHGRGFGVDNLQRMRAFYLAYPAALSSFYEVQRICRILAFRSRGRFSSAMVTLRPAAESPFP